jgi:hypothetical protein
MHHAGLYLCVHILVIKIYRKKLMFKLEFSLNWNSRIGEREH